MEEFKMQFNVNLSSNNLNEIGLINFMQFYDKDEKLMEDQLKNLINEYKKAISIYNPYFLGNLENIIIF